MSVLSFAQWVQSTVFFTALRGSAYVYPIVLSTHMIAIALFGGMILLVDVRLLGWAMRGYTVTEMVNQLRSVYRNTAALDAAPQIPKQAKLAASLSLILWTSLVIAGRGIGYIEPPLDKIHARLLAAPAIASTAIPAERRF